MSSINEQAGNRLAGKFVRSLGVGAVVLAVFAFGLGACMGCRYLIIDTGRAIVQP